MNRQFSFSDRIIGVFDNALKTLTVKPAAERPIPEPSECVEAKADTADLSEQEKKHSAGLMRVNHCGEVCAQALYHGQALFARDSEVAQHMHQASIEESDHLNWCHTRLEELAEKPSLLNPFFYASSFTIGAVSALAGDKWSLGFVAATEHQVLKHIDSHLAALPDQDRRSRGILLQMREDEARHADQALASGGTLLPSWFQAGMTFLSKGMTGTTYYY